MDDNDVLVIFSSSLQMFEAVLASDWIDNQTLLECID